MDLTIRCHACATLATGDVEEWLEKALRGLPDEAGARLLRTTERVPGGGRDSVGWLIDLGAAAEAELEGLMCDMRLLGLEPTLLRAAAEPSRGM